MDGMPQHPGVVAFVGPCLAAGAAHPLPELGAGIEWCPPARRGDLLAAVARRPHTLVLLDGYYYSVGAVTHKEILYALDAGIRVIGAASLGALRAAEMAALGMLGVGRIFGWFRDGVLDGDDEVALLHAPPEQGYRAITVALVEVRDALDHLLRRGAVEAAAAGALVGELKRLPFSERYPAAVLARADRLLGRAGRDLLAARLATHSLKAEDARQALALAATPAPARSAPAARLPQRVLDYLSLDRERFLSVPEPGPDRRPVTLAQAWAVAQLLHPQAPALVSGLRLRFLLASAAQAAGLAAAPDRRERLAAALEEPLGAGRSAALPPAEIAEEAWLQATSEAALAAFGGVEEALRPLARRLGLGEESPGRELLALVEGRGGTPPSWWLVRSFVFVSGFEAALGLARAAVELEACFRRWAQGARVRRGQLQDLAAALWGCPVEALAAEAARRALAEAHGYGIGFWEALALVAPAERLKRPINDYPERRARLLEARLEYLLPLPA